MSINKNRAMIDNIKIHLTNFSGNFDNCKLKPPPRQELIRSHDEKKKKRFDYNNYTLSNNAPTGTHKLSISKNNNTGTVIVRGSLRKRYQNTTIISDLNSKTFVECLKGIAKDLNITFKELKNATFTKCELGQTIKITIPIIEFLEMVVNYAHYERNDDYSGKGTLYFNGSDRTLKIYAKDKEIVDNSPKKIKEKKKAMFDSLNALKFYLLRLEFTLNNHRAFSHTNMGHIKTIGDLITYYSDLYSFWTKEVCRIVLYNSLKYKKEKLTKKEDEIISGLERLGFFDFLEQYQTIYMSKTTTKESAKSAKSKAYIDIINVVNKYCNRKEYNIYKFIDEVKTHLKSRCGNDINFDELEHFFDGTSIKK